MNGRPLHHHRSPLFAHRPPARPPRSCQLNSAAGGKSSSLASRWRVRRTEPFARPLKQSAARQWRILMAAAKWRRRARRRQLASSAPANGTGWLAGCAHAGTGATGGRLASQFRANSRGRRALVPDARRSPDRLGCGRRAELQRAKVAPGEVQQTAGGAQTRAPTRWPAPWPGSSCGRWTDPPTP